MPSNVQEMQSGGRTAKPSPNFSLLSIGKCRGWGRSLVQDLAPSQYLLTAQEPNIVDVLWYLRTFLHLLIFPSQPIPSSFKHSEPDIPFVSVNCIM